MLVSMIANPKWVLSTGQKEKRRYLIIASSPFLLFFSDNAAGAFRGERVVWQNSETHQSDLYFLPDG